MTDEKRKREEEDLDAIFAELTSKKTTTKKKRVTPSKKDTKAEESKRKKITKESDSEWKAAATKAGSEPKVHRYTSEGLPVYKYFHLGIQQEDGGTPLCPFDCDCCF